MSTRKRLGRSLALRPSAECLEGRQLLSGTVSGTDTAGDQWTITLSGKGSIQVIKQDDSSGNPGALDSATEIKSIIISGSDPFNTQVVGTVKAASGSDGRVFFQNLIEQPNRSEKLGIGLGIESINMPDFYLGQTSATSTSSTVQPVAAITIPDGINSLRFGGVDTTKFFGTDTTQSLDDDGQNDQVLIHLGVPASKGTRIVVNTITSSAQAAAASTSTTSTNSPTQKSVVFVVDGRLNLFQANEIDGSSTIPNTATSFDAGTIVSSLNDPASGLPGEIGLVRVGGNATNFTVVGNDKLANYYVGGETNNIGILAPGGTRRVYFGKGADTADIFTHTIESLQANRGITNSNIISERMIGDLVSGGNVSNSLIASGYDENLATSLATIDNNVSEFNQYFQTAITLATPTAEAAGKITTFISGNISNSVFVASVSPISQATTLNNTSFGDPQDTFLPLGTITAKLQGSINNATAAPNEPNLAFFAQKVNATNGVVVPPNVPEMPLSLPATPVSLPGIANVFPASNGTKNTKTTTTKGTGTPSNGSGPGIGTGSGTGTNAGTGTGTSSGASSGGTSSTGSSGSTT